MLDIIALLSDYYTSRNLPGFVQDIDNAYVSKSDNVYKIQSYVFKHSACTITQHNDKVVKYLWALLKPNTNYCVSVNLNHLLKHHIVIDIDLKKLTSPSTEFVQGFCVDVLYTIKRIFCGNPFEASLFIKLKSLEQITDRSVFEYAKSGVHIELPNIFLYRGDNIWFIQILQKVLLEKYGKQIYEIIDSPTNWSLPFSRKKSKYMYVPVRKYIFDNDKLTVVNILDTTDVHDLVQTYCIIRTNKQLNVQFHFDLDFLNPPESYRFGTSENVLINKSARLKKINQTISTKNLVLVFPNCLCHANYAISRFYDGNYSFMLTESAIEKTLQPFTIKQISEELTTQYYSHSSGDNKATGIFNLYIFFISLYDNIFTPTVLFRGEVLNYIDDLAVVTHYEYIEKTILDLIVYIVNNCNSFSNKSVTLNPILFIKCLFVQTYNELDKIEFVYDDSRNLSLYISKNIFNMVNENKLSMIELVKLMYPMYVLQKEGTIIYYEENKWISATKRLEHLYVPTNIFNKHKVLEMENIPSFEDSSTVPEQSKKRKSAASDNKYSKLFNYIYMFWARVYLLDVPAYMVGFKDGLVLVKDEYIVFHHSPIFQGQPSNLSWNKVIASIKHIHNPLCTYPAIFELLRSCATTSDLSTNNETEDVIDYFRYHYTREEWLKLDITDINNCQENEHCPVYHTLTYFLTLFSGDIELTFFMLWTLRYVLLGVSIKKSLILYGNGQNGKTTLSNVLHYLYGDSMNILSQETVHSKLNTCSPDIFKAKNARLVYADDVHRMNQTSLKQLVSGAVMFFRTLYNSGEEIHLKFLVMGSTNQNRFTNIDFATMKRILIIPFTKIFKDNTDYFCNNSMYEFLATNILATLFWLERFPQETNIFYGPKKNIYNPPKSVKWFSHQSVWKDDLTSTFLNVFNIREAPYSFVRVEDLLSEINLIKTNCKSFRSPINQLFEDNEATLNLLRHRYVEGKALNKSKKIYEDVICGITIDRLNILYQELLELV